MRTSFRLMHKVQVETPRVLRFPQQSGATLGVYEAAA